MTAGPSPSEVNRNIWKHYQNQDAASFKGAQPRLEYLLSRIARMHGAGSPRVLNIGAGSGYLERAALERGWQISSLDPDQGTVERLRGQGIDAFCGAMEDMPLESASLDFVVASEVLEHLDDAQRAAGIREVNRVLKAGGCFIGTVPYRENLAQGMVACPGCGEVFHRWGHQASFDPDGMQAQLRQVFPRVKVRVTAYLWFREAHPKTLLANLARYGLALLRVPISSTSLLFMAFKP